LDSAPEFQKIDREHLFCKIIKKWFTRVKGKDTQRRGTTVIVQPYQPADDTHFPLTTEKDLRAM